MNPEKVVFGFFIVLALTLNFGFFVGELDNPEHHNVWELFAVVVVNLIATVLKFGDRTQIGAVLLSTSLVAMLQLIAAVLVWAVAVHVTETGLTPSITASIVSLTGGAMIANVISVVLLVVETFVLRR
jgi:Ca2+/H+ antiporter, TMEM165/GDT1 family